MAGGVFSPAYISQWSVTQGGVAEAVSLPPPLWLWAAMLGSNVLDL